MVFEIVFLQACNFTDGDYKGLGGVMGVGGKPVRVGGKLEVDHHCHYSTDSSTVFSADYRNMYKVTG